MLRRLKALTLLGQSHEESASELVGAAVSASAGVVGTIGAVSTLGSVGGLSAAGMTSGLAALGVGSMATGIGVVAIIPIATGLAGYGVLKGIKNIAKARKLGSEQVDERLEIRLSALNGEPQDSMG